MTVHGGRRRRFERATSPDSSRREEHFCLLRRKLNRRGNGSKSGAKSKLPGLRREVYVHSFKDGMIPEDPTVLNCMIFGHNSPNTYILDLTGGNLNQAYIGLSFLVINMTDWKVRRHALSPKNLRSRNI
jgi:hypothetical protein